MPELEVPGIAVAFVAFVLFVYLAVPIVAVFVAIKDIYHW